MTQFFKDYGKSFIKIHNAKDISVEALYQAFKARLESEVSLNQDRIQEDDIIELTDKVE